MRSSLPALGLLLTLLVVSVAEAATPPAPGTVLERARDQRESRELQRRLQQPPVDDSPRVIDETGDGRPAAGGAETRFLLRRVEFSASEVFDAAELDRVAARYVGQQVSVQDLFALVAEINALYRERGVIAAKALLPPQRIADGLVRIRLVEGRVGQVLLEGNASTLDGFITGGFSVLAPGTLVYLDALEADLLYFNAVNDIDVRAVLQPGEAFGTTDYLLQVTEPTRTETVLFADNAGRDDIGLYRFGINHIDRSFSGRRDLLSLGGYVAEGTQALYAAYTLPLTSRGTRLGLSADYNRIEIIDGDLEPLDVTGDSFNASVLLIQPLDVRRDRLINGSVGYNFKESDTDFDDVTLFSTRVRSLQAGVDLQHNDFGESTFARVNVTAAPSTWGNDQSFWRINADFSRIDLLQNGWVLLLRARAQWSPDDLLPSSEQFQLGGMTTVRGFPEGLLIGDRGYFGSAEFSFPIAAADALDPLSNPFTQRWRGLLFVDHGGAFPFKGNDESIDDDDFLTSVGGGVNLNLDGRTQGRLLVGFPLVSRDDGEDGIRLHFYLQHML